jgi:hypothetical protein
VGGQGEAVVGAELGFPSEEVEEGLVVLRGFLVGQAFLVGEAVGARVDQRVELEGFPSAVGNGADF